MSFDSNLSPLPSFVVNGDVPSEPSEHRLFTKRAWDNMVEMKDARIAELEAHIAAQQRLINELMDRELTE